MIRFALILLMSLAVSSQAVAAVKWNNPGSKNKTQKEPIQQLKTSKNVNQTTSRFIRNKYSCIIGKDQSQRPVEVDNKDLSGMNFGLAYLDDDNSLDWIQGYDKEPKNEFNITEPLDYKVFLSSKKKFMPSVKTLMARKMLIQDFNNDGRDDVFFLSTGNHKPPLKGGKNTLLISTIDGHDYLTVSGGKNRSHGGAAGDFDKDGDIDVIVANGSQKTVQLLINKGNGTFKAKTFLPNFKHGKKDYFYTAEVWDLDEDGVLDIVLGTPEVGLAFFWGKPSSKDNPKFSSIQRFSPSILRDRLPLDMAFADFDSDGNVEMAMIDSRIFEKRYRGWGITIVDFDRSRDPRIKAVYDDDPGQNYHWYGWIDACDVDGDGDIDLSAQTIGNTGDLRKYPNVGKIEWINNQNDWQQQTISRSVLHGAASNTSSEVKQMPATSNLKVDNSRPAYKVKMEKLCSKAIVDSEWNNLAPGWVEVAKSRGFTVDMCQKALTPIETIRANNKPDNDYLIKLNKLCSDAITGNNWSKTNLGSVAAAKDRGFTVQMCKMAIEKCKDMNCSAE